VKLSEAVQKELNGDYKLYVKTAYVSNRHRYQDSRLHYQGRAFDLTLISSKTERIVTAVHTLSWLGEVAFKHAKFSYVRFTDKKVIHASCACSGECVKSCVFKT